MAEILLIFGAEGSLGKGAGEVLIKKNYDRIYLVNRKFNYFKETDKVKLIECEDLTVEKNVEEVFNKIETGKDDAFYLFSTVGGFFGGKNIEETEYTEWQRMMDMNLNSSFLIAREFTKKARGCRKGGIIFTGSVAANTPDEGKAAYSVSKNALNFLIKCLASEIKKYNLSVNVISPMIIDTPENREWMKNQDKLTSPGEIAEAVNALFTMQTFITGSIIELPGK